MKIAESYQIANLAIAIFTVYEVGNSIPRKHNA